jgi:hypothetical protein
MHMSRGVPLIFGEDHESHDARVLIDGDRDGPGHADNNAEEQAASAATCGIFGLSSLIVSSLIASSRFFWWRPSWIKRTARSP